MSNPSICRHGGPRATSHILECINMMINHSEFGVSEEEFEAYEGDEGRLQELYLENMGAFIARHPEAAGDDAIKTLTSLAMDELLLEGNLENARLFFQPVPFLKFFKEHGLDNLQANEAQLKFAVEQVNLMDTEEGMLKLLKESVGGNCKCLSLYSPGEAINPMEQPPDDISYPELVASQMLHIPVKSKNHMEQDSRVHVELRRLCPPHDKPPYLCIIIVPAGRYILHSFPVEETDAERAFEHVLEGIVMAILTEGMGMIDEEVRIRPAQLTTTDPLLAKYLAPLLEGTRVSVASSCDRIESTDRDAKEKPMPLIAIMDGVFADFNLEIQKANSSRKLPIGDTLAEEARWKFTLWALWVWVYGTKHVLESSITEAETEFVRPASSPSSLSSLRQVKSRSRSGREKFVVDKEKEPRGIPDRLIACKGCRILHIRSAVKQCSLCSEAWYCTSKCQADDWTKGHKTECSRRTEAKKKAKDHASEDSGDDPVQNARLDALNTFDVDLAANLPGAVGGQRKRSTKKGKRPRKRG